MTSTTDILRGHILIVDDQEANVRLLERMLRAAGYDSVTSTTDPTTVCELHLVNHYDLILLDLHMPGMDGFQVMENLKEIEPNGYLPVLVITAQPEHKLRALKAGARDFVSKPFDLAEVLIRVHNMLEVRFLQLESRQLYERLLAEQKLGERILRGLPAVVTGPGSDVAAASEPRRASGADKVKGLVAESYAEVALVFADVAELASFSEGASARVLVRVLDDLSLRLDGDEPSRARAKDDIVGDAYVDAVGLPGPVVDHTILTASKAVDLSAAVARLNSHTTYAVKVRIAFRSSTVAERKFFHDL